MVFRALLTVLCAALLVPASAAAKAPASAILVACERGDAPAGVFEGEMSAVPGAERMQMRFKLQRRTARRWRTVSAPGFGEWLTSDPGTSRYVYTKRVENMVGPGYYRVQIRFRWLDEAGEPVLSSRASSRRCKQPDPRANLAVRDIGVERGMRADRRSYVVLVRNSGRSEAEPSSLALTVAGESLPAAPVPALAPGEYTLVTIDGPACAEGEPLLALADAAEVVDERSERDNRFRARCSSG
jgi:hypothetical protein